MKTTIDPSKLATVFRRRQEAEERLAADYALQALTGPEAERAEKETTALRCVARAATWSEAIKELEFMVKEP